MRDVTGPTGRAWGLLAVVDNARVRATDGSSVADLTRYMARYKLLFGPADKGDEEVYTTLHRGLAWYLMALRQHNAPKK